jgi:hypothetical protein
VRSQKKLLAQIVLERWRLWPGGGLLSNMSTKIVIPAQSPGTIFGDGESGGSFCILKKSQLPHLEHHLFMAGPRAACAILKKTLSEILAARWSYLPGGGFWWSTMSANIEIPVHTSIYFFWSCRVQGVHVLSFKKKEPSEMVAARWSHLPGGAVGGQPCQSKLRSWLTHPFTFSVMAAPRVLVIFARGWW